MMARWVDTPKRSLPNRALAARSPATTGRGSGGLGLQHHGHLSSMNDRSQDTLNEDSCGCIRCHCVLMKN